MKKGRMWRIAMLAAVVAVVGCSRDRTAGGDAAESGTAQETGPAGQSPAYAYYVKGSCLMQVDVNALADGKQDHTRVVYEGIAAATLKDYDRAIYAPADGVAAVRVNIPVEAGEGSVEGALIAVDETAGSAELLCRNYSIPMVKNGRLYYQAYSDQEEEGLCLYAYDPERGNERMISDIHNLFADCEADSIVFSRADEAGMQTIYRYRDGGEETVCEGAGRAMADRAADAIYLRQNISEDGGSWELLSRISEDGFVEEILTKEDNAWAAYSGKETGAVYYMCVEADDDNWKLYYYDPQTEEKTCLEKRMQMLGGFLPVTAERKQQGFTEDIIFYYALEGETSWLWMAVGGEPVRLELDNMGDGAASLLEDSEVIGGDVYLALKNYELDTGKLFRLRREADGWSETCVAEGTAPALERLRGTDGELVADALFSSDYAWSDEAQEYRNSLWADGKQILDRYTPFGLLCMGQNGTEYYALQDVSAECAPNLMRINTAGGSKVFHEGVALCEAWNGGLLMLADCAAEYPYLGTLYFYDGQQTVQIDTDVTVFYGHDSRRLADGVPYVWDWSGEG